MLPLIHLHPENEKIALWMEEVTAFVYRGEESGRDRAAPGEYHWYAGSSAPPAVAADKKVVLLSYPLQFPETGDDVPEHIAAVIPLFTEVSESAAVVTAVLYGYRLRSFVHWKVPPEDDSGDDALVSPLSSREETVLSLLASGEPNKSIAFKLGISESTVKYHISSLFNKLKVQNRAELVSAAFRAGCLAV